MTEIKWTDSQLDAIESRDCNILVSAAAGSGKTTVLVERVMRLIMDKDKPIDIGSLVIMTFTKAAASQMKEKIYRGIKDAIKKDPLNENLRRQLHQVHKARICTIDSLCMEIVKENFHLVDVDPGFRIADQSEEAILKNDVLKELIEAKYQDPSDSFLELVNFYIDKSDSKLEELIKILYSFSQSYPEPDKWISDSVVAYTGAETNYYNASDEQNKWLFNIGACVEEELIALKEMAEEGIVISNQNYGPYQYNDYFEDLVSFFDSIIGEDKIFDFRRESIDLKLLNWSKKPAIRGGEVDENLKKIAFDLIDNIKKKLSSLKEKYFQSDLISAFSDISSCSNVARELASLAIEFGKRYKLAKWERNIADFNDVAHYALMVLIKHDDQGNIIYDENGTPVYTAVADQMANEIREIVVDEYQDTNMLQEYIIGALSAKRFGRPDVFMVGDVKQSIYGFRKACPELFIEKYNQYAEGDRTDKKVLLNANYRSRAEVLDFTNYIFEQVMIPQVGGIDYTDGHGLVCGAKYPTAPEKQFVPEIIHVDAGGKEGRYGEAYLIAEKIEELVKNGLVTDKNSGELRKAEYLDIAILSRTANNPEIEQMLQLRSIPVVKISNSGFFDTFEIRLLVDLLKIIDNPYQDIPFTAVLTSPIVGLDGNELAGIKMRYEPKPFCMYKASLAYLESSENEALKNFIELLEYLRMETTRLGVCQLIEEVLEESDFYTIVESLPQGDIRKANIELFKTMALRYSKTSYSGLFNFLRYLKQMQDADIDLGEAQLFTSGMNAVQMMTIHKSKGLEFPIVIIVNSAKDYNKLDLSSSIVLDRELGMGIEYRNPVERLKKKTLVMASVIAAKERELYAEEMRLLYVALTRAKEKLIITSRGSGINGMVASWVRELYRESPQVSSDSIMSSGNYLKTMGRALIRHKDASELWGRFGFEEKDIKPVIDTDCSFDISIWNIEDVEEKRANEVCDDAQFLYNIENMIEEYSDKDDTDIKNILDYEYPYAYATVMDVKRTASSLEVHKDYQEGKEGKETKKPAYLFKYTDDETGLRGAERGNAYHKLFELFEYDKVEIDNALESVRKMIEGFVEAGLLSNEYAMAINPGDYVKFINSSIGKRMKAAYEKETLVREQQFVMGIDNQGEQQLIQGIIDAFFEEDGEIVLVDYKTDKNKTEEDFITTYENQLNAYADALQRATGKNVKEKVIYSVELGREIVF